MNALDSEVNIELEKPIDVFEKKVQIGLEEPIDVVDNEVQIKETGKKFLPIWIQTSQR